MILDSITGVGPRAAEVILAEIGPDMSRFSSAGHLAVLGWALSRTTGVRGSARVGQTTQGITLAGRCAH
jgi:transposase